MRRRRFRFLLPLIALTTVLTLAESASAQRKDPPLKRVPGTRVSLLPVEGFLPSERFTGLEYDTLGASIRVEEFPRPGKHLIGGLDKKTLREQGLIVQKSMEWEFDGRPGLLVHVGMEVGRFEKWIAAFGDEKSSVLLTATYPKSHSREFHLTLKRVLRKATWEAPSAVDPFDGWSFSLTPPKGLKYARDLERGLVFTENGKYPTRSPLEPLFVVERRKLSTVPSDKEAYARSLLGDSQLFRKAKITGKKPLTVDRRAAAPVEVNGVEVRGRAQSRQTRVRVFFYQAVYFLPGTKEVVILRGTGSEDEEKELTEKFSTAARSLKRQAKKASAPKDKK